MDNIILEQLLSYILQPYLQKNIISIINSYNRPLYYYILVKTRDITLFGINPDTIFQACSIKDVIKYIVFSLHETSENYFLRYGCEIRFSLLRDRFIKSLSTKEKKHFNADTFNFFRTMPEKKKQVLLLAQELYGKNPKLFLKDIYAEEKEFIKCNFLTEYTDLFKCIKKGLSSYKCGYTNVYTKHKTIVNFKQESE